ncbi:MAG: hypothetical protein OEZ06_01845 [Myxococcales bacterium]|nr:hypothetical protein [Myxococcales bacterium]
MTSAPESAVARVLPAGARCPRHPERGATGVCFRCGDYLCGACAARVQERLHCPGCASRVRDEHSPRSSRVLVFGLMSAHGIFVLAPFAVVMGLLELQAIAAGDAPLGGLWLTRAGVWLGLCGVAMPAVFLAAYLATH